MDDAIAGQQQMQFVAEERHFLELTLPKLALWMGHSDDQRHRQQLAISAIARCRSRTLEVGSHDLPLIVYQHIHHQAKKVITVYHELTSPC
ncbi:MAG: hypothetical protein JNJ61_26100 [Anaerolineae bacterium]|nr:hypothetical protein [Anaerolineae bacterium]